MERAPVLVDVLHAANQGWQFRSFVCWRLLVHVLDVRCDRVTDVVGHLLATVTPHHAEVLARPTADELQDARNGSVAINSSNGEATLSFNIEESEDLKTWQATGEKITKTIQLKDGKKFYRFALDK